MVYRLRAIKTAYHTGTLEVAVVYGGVLSPNTDGRSNVCHRVLWDLALMDSIVVRVPFVHHVHWAEFDPILIGTPVDGNNVYVKAHTALNAPPNVAQQVEILVEQWSPDMQVAWPAMAKVNPVGFPLRAKTSKAEGKEPIRPQGLHGSYATDNQGPFDPGQVHELQPDVLLGPYQTRQNSILAERYLAGEHYPSLRRCFRRFLKAYTYTWTPPVEDDKTWVVAQVPDLAALHRWHRALLELFVFAFGGLRAKVVRLDDSKVYKAKYGTRASLDKDDDEYSPEPIQVFAGTDTPVVEANLPLVSNYPYYVIDNNFMVPLSLTLESPAGTYDVYLATGDDFSCFGINYLDDYVTESVTRLANSPKAVP